jgi:hypothetical protein
MMIPGYREICGPCFPLPALKTKTPPKRGLRYRVAAGLRLHDVDEAAILVAANFELNRPVDQRKQRMVAT